MNQSASISVTVINSQRISQPSVNASVSHQSAYVSYSNQSRVSKKSHVHNNCIYELIETRMDGSEDQKKWLSLYPQALSDILAALSLEEVAEAERLVEEWSNKGIPVEKQRAYVLFLLSR